MWCWLLNDGNGRSNYSLVTWVRQWVKFCHVRSRIGFVSINDGSAAWWCEWAMNMWIYYAYDYDGIIWFVFFFFCYFGQAQRYTRLTVMNERDRLRLIRGIELIDAVIFHWQNDVVSMVWHWLVDGIDYVSIFSVGMIREKNHFSNHLLSSLRNISKLMGNFPFRQHPAKNRSTQSIQSKLATNLCTNEKLRQPTSFNEFLFRSWVSLTLLIPFERLAICQPNRSESPWSWWIMFTIFHTHHERISLNDGNTLCKLCCCRPQCARHWPLSCGDNVWCGDDKQMLFSTQYSSSNKINP